MKLQEQDLYDWQQLTALSMTTSLVGARVFIADAVTPSSDQTRKVLLFCDNPVKVAIFNALALLDTLLFALCGEKIDILVMVDKFAQSRLKTIIFVPLLQVL